MSYKFFLILFLVIGLHGYAQTSHSEFLFDDDWKFFLGDVKNGEKLSMKDEPWNNIDLPHDWSILDLPGEDNEMQIGPFSSKSEGKRATGFVVGGTGWYRKHFTLNKEDEGKIIKILFDGVYMNANLWINGKHLGNHPYGYTAFSYDLTNYLNPAGKENVLAVQVKNEGKNSRWYSGSGIYRHVWLIKKQPVHIVIDGGVFITTEDISGNKAKIKVATVVEKTSAGSSKVKLLTKIIGPNGKISQSSEAQTITLSSGKSEFVQDITIPQPELWSTETPNLYSAKIQVVTDGVVTDEVSTSFGIRTIHFDAKTGFTLNGKTVFLKGGCLHHDNGFLGSATIDRAEERKVELMKAYGYNAIRTSHNPPSKQFLDACDHIGILVIDEAFDMWEKSKNPEDYHLYFNDWWQKDLESMVLRDRNHPSVIFWSVGNEIPERVDSLGLAIRKRLVNKVRILDLTRPITEGICEFWDRPGQKWITLASAFADLNVGGYNYRRDKYESDHESFPERIMMGTESYSKESYDYWHQVEKNSWVIGDFVWTAMDYLGEARLGNSQLVDTVNTRRGVGGFSRTTSLPTWFNSFCGDIDLCGFKKTPLLYRDVVWNNSELEIVVHSPIPAGKREMVSDWGWPDELPSWNWAGNEGKTMNIRIFTSYPAIRLELNGKIIDEKIVSDTSKLIVNFKVPYEPGVLKAIALNNGIEVASKELRTTGVPTKIKLTADRTKIKADRNDLSYVKVEITDIQGNRIPDSDFPIKFTVSGVGKIAGSGNACPYDMASFNSPVCKTYQGQALVILQPLKEVKTGTITLKAEATGLISGELNVIVGSE